MRGEEASRLSPGPGWRRPPREHPRVRGEEWRAQAAPRAAAGTPPRARGGGAPALHAARHRGNTPACAGRSGSRSMTGLGSREHPRVRGEEAGKSAHLKALAGTPPRARGGDHLDGQLRDPGGNTPACAGRRRSGRCGRPGSREHPRVRGEEIASAIARHACAGTPPRARGGGGVAGGVRPTAGNTPACAGRSPRLRRGCRPAREHPRVRGEETVGSSMGAVRVGTPPRARGGGLAHRRAPARPGNTPACAGRRSAWSSWPRPCWEHPRVRGEELAPSVVEVDRMGTPPRARGGGLRGRLRLRVGGNTPACAGRRGRELRR